jgi:hypothetical protein
MKKDVPIDANTKTPPVKKNIIGIIIIVIGVVFSFLLFIYGVGVYIYQSKEIFSIVKSLTKDLPLNSNEIESLKALQIYYRDSSNFNIISLVYIFISFILMGTLGMYVQHQKERMEGFEDKSKTLFRKITKRDNDVKELRDKLSEQINKIDNINIQLNKFTILQSLGNAQTYAIQIFTKCNNKEKKPEEMSVYTTWLRDIIYDRSLEEKINSISKSSCDKFELIKQIDGLVDILSGASHQNNSGYKKTTHDDFINKLNSYSKLLNPDRIRGI